jgi:hypothetical protein
MRRMLLGCGLLLMMVGCTDTGTTQYALGPTLPPFTFESSAVGNPAFVPITDPQGISDLTSEVVGTYFRIRTEEPVRLIGNTLTEGRIETVAEVSPTLLEPWRADTASLDQRLDNTLQTYRRRAVVRILPAENGHWVDVAVFLELEDMPRPEHSSAGAATFRYDSSFQRVQNPIGDDIGAQGWIPKGRDAVLEQRILGHLQQRAQEWRGR